MRKKRLGLAALAALGLLGLGVAGVAGAAPVTMTFDGLHTTGNGGQSVADYYNGGCGASYNGGPVTCSGDNYGAVWTGAAVARGGLFSTHAPSAPNTLFRGNPGNLTGPVPTMNVANGFTSGFSFWYSSSVSANAVDPASVEFYSGLDGTGDLLYTTGTLAKTSGTCGVAGLFVCWDFIGVPSFTDAVYSVMFNGPTNGLEWDSISFDMRPAATGVPEPSVLGMFGFGALLLGLFAGLRRRFN